MPNCGAISYLVYILLTILAVSHSLELVELRVPATVAVGSRAALACRWRLAAGELLYSVKWYKDGREFFRHVPRELQQRRYPLPGVHVESSDASGSSLILSPAAAASGGRYRCEVSGERPLFPTVSDHRDMTVVELPKHGPTISGLHSHYRVGDRVQVTCTSEGSTPATTLSWYVNGEPASSLMGQQTREVEDPDGLVTNSLSLDFVLEEKHFKDGAFNVKCLATLDTVYWRSSEESAQKVVDHAVTSARRHHHQYTGNSSNSSRSRIPRNNMLLVCLAAVVFTKEGCF